MMPENHDDVLAAGAAAWSRIRDHEKATWTDWLDVARALAIGRTVALKVAGTNQPVGTRYNTAMGVWLRENGLADIVAQERYRLFLILQNLAEIEAWRAGLSDAQRRRLNHPNAVWSHWRKHKTDDDRGAPEARNRVKAATASHKHGKPVYFSQDVVRRAAMALRECGSNDIFKLARVMLEAAIRNEHDLVDLLNEATKPQHQAKAPAAELAHA
jgi:hypothetical protein